MSENKKNLLKEMLPELQKEYEKLKKNPKKLDLTRGRPSSEQLDLSNGLLTILNDGNYLSCEGIDCRNYGGVDGILEMRELFAEILKTSPENILVGGNSSLNMMFDIIGSIMMTGINGELPWKDQGKIKFLCPSPGYDRHFAICKYFGIEMIQIPMFEEGSDIGPDMDLIEEFVESDESIKGVWCVPKYSNPSGITYSDDVVRRFANLNPKALDFKIFWDNAYVLHGLYDDDEKLLNILDECKNVGSPDLVFEFTSFSKISLAGNSVSCVAGSEKNIDHVRRFVSIQTVGPNKTNQLSHVKFFKNLDNIKSHLKKHSELLRPKFEVVINTFEKELRGYDIAKWNSPKGGYFISFYSLPGLAEKIIKYCGECGLKLNLAGSTFPYNKDPYGNNIRIAPSFSTLEEVKEATKIFCLCVKLASANW